MLLIKLVSILFDLFVFALFLWAIMSWFPNFRSSKLYSILEDFFNPILAPIRSVIPSIGGLDLSPIILMFLIQILERFIVSSLGLVIGG